VLLEDFARGMAVQANQHLIIHNGHGMVLDPGGHKVYAKVCGAVIEQLKGGELKYIFFSHQDPDCIAACNGWLMTTDADAYISALWTRFVPHFGLDDLVFNRLKGIPDEGMILDLNGAPLVLLPAHYMHSEGNFQVYDPTSKILYTGDLGASLARTTGGSRFRPASPVHRGLHRRYMVSGKVLKAGPAW